MLWSIRLCCIVKCRFRNCFAFCIRIIMWECVLGYYAVVTGNFVLRLKPSASNYRSTQHHTWNLTNQHGVISEGTNLQATSYTILLHCFALSDIAWSRMTLTPTVPWFNCFKVIKGSRYIHQLDQISYLIYYSHVTMLKIYYEKLPPNLKSPCYRTTYVHELTLRVFLYFLEMVDVFSQ